MVAAEAQAEELLQNHIGKRSTETSGNVRLIKWGLESCHPEDETCREKC